MVGNPSVVGKRKESCSNEDLSIEKHNLKNENGFVIGKKVTEYENKCPPVD